MDRPQFRAYFLHPRFWPLWLGLGLLWLLIQLPYPVLLRLGRGLGCPAVRLSVRGDPVRLRQVLSNLNRYCTQQFGPEVLQIQRGSVGLLRGERILFDVDVLVQAPCDAIHLLSDQRIFLDGMEDIADLEFQAWLQTTRQMLEVQLISSVERCCDQMIERARWDSAIDLANALSRRDPWNEAHVQRAMRAHAGNGSSCEALTAYQRLEAFLRSDLGLDPCQETRRLLQQISALGSVVRAAPVHLSATI